ncbi:TPA: DNA binding protein, partial [Pseudomonas aeruginosa]|nr:DNA binding protein [Pseudomonas aeruginosa]
ALEAQLAQQLAQLDALKNDKALKREIEFESKLRALLDEYDCKLQHVIAILDPQASRPLSSSGNPKHAQRRERIVKVYINPHTNERVETKGGNHSILKAWKAEYGAEAVASWLQ